MGSKVPQPLPKDYPKGRPLSPPPPSAKSNGATRKTIIIEVKYGA